MQPVLSIADWEKLDEVSLPKIKRPADKGAFYVALKVGILFTPNASDYSATRYKGHPYLPTITIQVDTATRILRLPLDLAPWAFDAVALAHSGLLSFPAEIEFGILKNRVYAEYVL
jgi:hypothetical protein